MNHFKVRDSLVRPELNQLIRNGETILLEPKVMEALLLLAQNHQQLTSRQQIRDALWPDTVVSDHATNRVISHLRRAFGDNQTPYQLIETVAKKGYRLIEQPEYLPQISARQPAIQSGNTLISDKLKPNKMSQPKIKFGVILGLLAFCISLLLGRQFYLSNAVQTFLPKKAVTAFTTLPGREYAMAYNHNQQYLAFIHHDRANQQFNLMVKSKHDEHPRSLLTTVERIGAFSWAPDKNEIIVALYGENGCHLEQLKLSDNNAELIKQSHLLNCFNRALISIAWPRALDSELNNASQSNLSHSNLSQSNLLYFATVENGQPADLLTLDLTAKPFHLQRNLALSGVYAVTASHNGQHLSLLKQQQFERSQIYLYDRQAQTERLFYQSPFFLKRVSWARDDSALFYLEDNQFKLHGMNDKPQSLPYSSEHLITDVYFSPTEDEFFYSRIKAQGKLVALENHQGQWRQSQPPVWQASAAEYHPVYSNDGSQLAFFSNRSGQQQIWIVDSHNQLRTLDTGQLDLSQTLLYWSFDDQYILYHADRSLFRYDLKRNMNQQISPSHLYADAVAWSPVDNNQVFLRSDDNGKMNIWQLNIETQQLTPVTQDGAFSGRISKDGHFIYFTKQVDAGLWRLDLNSQQQLKVIDNFHPANWTSWHLTDKGVYFARGERNQRGVFFYEFATDHTQTLWLAPAGINNQFTIHPAENTIMLNLMTTDQSNIMRLEG